MNRKSITGIVILLIVYVVFKYTGPMILTLINSMSDPNEYLEVYSTTKNLSYILNLIKYGFSLAIGIFLIFEAKREGMHRGLWFCVGAIFGIVGLILFYIYGIYELLKKSSTHGSNDTLNQDISSID